MSAPLEQALFDVTDNDAGRAAFYLVASLLGQLVQKDVLSPEEGVFVGALAAHAARAQGHRAVAAAIEAVIEGSAGVDVEAHAEEYGVTITKATKQ